MNQIFIKPVPTNLSKLGNVVMMLLKRLCVMNWLKKSILLIITNKILKKKD